MGDFRDSCFLLCWLRKLPEYYFLAQAFANLHGKRKGEPIPTPVRRCEYGFTGDRKKAHMYISALGKKRTRKKTHICTGRKIQHEK